MKVLILNGPPHSGKDTIGSMLMEQIPCFITSFKFDLYQETSNFFRVGSDWFKDVATDRKYKDCVHFEELGFRTPREALIYVSEEVSKPKYGKDHYGQLAKLRIAEACKSNSIVIFTDGGFSDEIAPLKEIADVTIVQLHGRGTFANDSRDYVELDSVKQLKLQLVNDKPQLAVDTIIEYLTNG